MSVLELTLSYTRSVAQGEFETPSFALHEKKKMVIIAFGTLLATAVLYLYMSVSVVAQNYERDRLTALLRQTSAHAQEIEQRALGAHSVYTAQYFIENGFEEPKELGIIKRVNNVAEVSSSHLY